MKVYAEFIEENNIGYRKTTILQFGDSWNLIGSLVLKNPGSAKIERRINDEEFFNLSEFNRINHNTNIDKSNWFKFKSDSTINLIIKIFSGWYISKEKELNGVIQLFNLFYLKDKNISSAMNDMKYISSKYLYPEAKELCQSFKDKPVYLGWGDLYKINELKDNAQEIFDFVKNKNSPIYNDKIMNNNFCHPLGLMSHYPRANNQKILKSFFELLE